MKTTYEIHTDADHDDILSSPNGVDQIVDCKDCNGIKWLFKPNCIEPLTIYPTNQLRNFWS